MVTFLVFIMATLEKVFGRKKTMLNARGPVGGNVFKNPARIRKCKPFTLFCKHIM